MNHTQHGTGARRRCDTQPGRTGQVRHAIAQHRTHDKVAFQAKVDPTAALGKTFTQTDKQKRRADTNRTAEHGDYNSQQTDLVVDHAGCAFGCSFGCNQRTRP